jgi:diguanylate cyclase (GGDEF)-like protein
MGGRRASALHRGAVVVLCLVAAWILWQAATTIGTEPPDAWPAVLTVLALYAIARRYPLRLSGEADAVRVDPSLTFGFAALLLLPAELAVIALTVLTLVPPPDRSGTPWLQASSDVARAAIVYGIGAWALAFWGELALEFGLPLTAGTGVLGAGSVELIAVVLPAGLLAAVVEVVLRATLTALDQQARLRSVLRQDHAPTGLFATLVLIGLAPAIVGITERSLLLPPLVVAALWGLHRASRVSATQHHEAMHDQLTGLPNRRALESRLDALLGGAGLRDRTALLLMDLDRFKEVNDQLGHHVGDELLGQVGLRLRGLDGIELAARIGGDEFAFVLRRASDIEALVEVGDQLVTEVSRPYVVADVQLSIGASIGIATFPYHGLDGPSLLRRADAAMYAAKRRGMPVGVATVQRGATTPGRLSLLGELEAAMDQGQLTLDYQPQIDLVTGEVVGVESLLRWHHPEHGLVPPGAFVATVEHTELIMPLTRHVLGLALDDATRWEVAGVTVPIAVNISARDLADPRLPRELDALLATHDFPPRELTLEITETALQHEPDRATEILGELRELGVSLSIDDFGTGYSSLATLRDLPVTELKIDRTFVAAMETVAGVAIVRSVTQLAHALGLRVVAEGVEHAAHLEELRHLACDVGQGFLISRPLPGRLVAPWVRARREELRATGDHVLARAAAPGRSVRGDGTTERRMRAV